MSLTVGGRSYEIARIAELGGGHDLARLPYTLRILLENVLRAGDEAGVHAVGTWDAVTGERVPAKLPPVAVTSSTTLGPSWQASNAIDGDATASLTILCAALTVCSGPGSALRNSCACASAVALCGHSMAREETARASAGAMPAWSHARAAAAEELLIRRHHRSLFDVRAPGFRQSQLLGRG